MKSKYRFISSFIGRLSSFLHKNRRRIIGGVIFVIGCLLGFGFNILAVIADLNGASFWGDVRNAMNFKHDQPTYAELVRIRCPILLAPEEEGTITATFFNPNQVKADISVKVAVSERDFKNFRTVTGSLTIPAQAEKEFSWQINKQDMVEWNFALSRIFLMYDGNPARTNSCGIYFLNLFGLKGSSMIGLALGTSLIGLLVGSILLYPAGTPQRENSPRIEVGLYLLAALLLISMVGNLLGWWIFGGLVLVLAVLLTIVIIPSMLHLSV